MRVLLFPSSSAPVGVATHVLNLARLLASTGKLESVVCAEAGWLTERLVAEGLPCQVLDLSYRPFDFLRSNWAFFRWLQSRPASCLVHIHGRFPLFVSVLSMVFTRCDFVATVHEAQAASRPGRWGWKHVAETILLKRMKRIVCVSRSLSRALVDRLGPETSRLVTVIPNWIELMPSTNTVPPATHICESQGLRICAVGRLDSVKGFDILIDALAMLLPTLQFTCDIFGEGAQRDMLAGQIVAHGLSERVFLQGRSERIREVLPSYDLVVIPSRMESFGLVALEAFDACVPVIASNVDGLNEVVVDEDCGLLFEPENPIVLADTILRAAESPRLRSQLAERGKQRLLNFLPGPWLMERYDTFYFGSDLEYCGDCLQTAVAWPSSHSRPTTAGGKGVET